MKSQVDTSESSMLIPYLALGVTLLFNMYLWYRLWKGKPYVSWLQQAVIVVDLATIVVFIVFIAKGGI